MPLAARCMLLLLRRPSRRWPSSEPSGAFYGLGDASSIGLSAIGMRPWRSHGMRINDREIGRCERLILGARRAASRVALARCSKAR